VLGSPIGVTNPIRGIFPGCCASATTATASRITATKIDDTPDFFIVRLMRVIYHAERRGLSNKNSRGAVTLTRRSNVALDWFVGDPFNPGVAAWLFDDPIHQQKHIRWNRQTDLFGCFQSN
jgi:hypothetical protein